MIREMLYIRGDVFRRNRRLTELFINSCLNLLFPLLDEFTPEAFYLFNIYYLTPVNSLTIAKLF